MDKWAILQYKFCFCLNKRLLLQKVIRISCRLLDWYKKNYNESSKMLGVVPEAGIDKSATSFDGGVLIFFMLNI